VEALAEEAGGPPVAGAGRARRALVFVGFMGAGKSSAARTVAAELGVEPLDTDRELERRVGRSLEAFFDARGEVAFRAAEEEVVLELLARDDARVIALGGGSLGSERVREALSDHVVVHLEVDPGDAWHRAAGRGRPLARDHGRFVQLHADRHAVYEAAADATLPPDGREAVRRALPALERLRGAPAGTRLLWARSGSDHYPVFFGRGLLSSGFFPLETGRRLVVSDAAVAERHRLPGVEPVMAIPAGEQEKTLARAEEVLRALARAGATREVLVVAVGGGVVGDLVGFCAAVYQRGVAHVQVPTTLVAQVDSAYGGKTGVDLPEGKNYAGAYHQPSAVLVDPAVLDTLPDLEHAAGYAEVVKTALIAGGPLWARVRGGGGLDDSTILGCVRTKLSVVAEDERDEGARQALNLGHTVAHAIEAATGYARYRHGEAVGIGLLCALRLSGRDALRAEVADLLAARGLPLAYEGADVEEVLGFVARDKKRRGGRVGWVLLSAPGEVQVGQDLPDAAVREALEEARAR